MWKNISIPASKLINSTLLKTESLLTQQCRTTFIVKRKWPPGLHKKNENPKKLRGRNFVYDLVEDTNIRKHELMKVILTSYVEGVGTKGDVVSVKPNYAYNNLLLPKLGVYLTAENLAKYAKKEDEIEEDKEVHSSPHAAQTVALLEKLLLSVTMNKDVPWTLEPWHIRACFRKAGIHVTEEAIALPPKPITGPDMSIENKEFYVTITINNMEKANVRCRIHHWSTKPSDRLPYNFEFWKKPSEPIFPEDSQILNMLPSRFEKEQIEEDHH